MTEGIKYDQGKPAFELIYWSAILPIIEQARESPYWVEGVIHAIVDAQHAATHDEMVQHLTRAGAILVRIQLEEQNFPIHSLAQVLAFGAEKYDAWNWARGMKWSRLFGAAYRHLVREPPSPYLWDWTGLRPASPYDEDEETGLPHYSHALCCIMFLIAYALEGKGEDDRPGVF